jgi:phage terminase large subunit
LSNPILIRAEIPEKLRFLFEPHRYKVVHGGRGGAKSWSMARALLIRSLTTQTRVLCARELQVSITDSVHQLLSSQIEALGYSPFFHVTRSSIRCTVSGSEFIFAGIRSNITKIKSMEGIDVAWVEEAEAVSKESWSVLVPTIRKEGSEIWVSFNPDLETDDTYRRFIKSPPPAAKVVEIGWQDNPWFPETLRAEKDHLYSVDADAAAHIWGGKTRSLSDALVLAGKVSVEPFEPAADWDGPYQGADWGFANDPTVLIRCWVHEDRLYIEHEAYGVGVEITDTPALFDTVPSGRKYVTRADNARPETISHMRGNGYAKMVAAKKGPGSVEDGVAHLRGYAKIVIHPRCRHAIDESRLWSYKKNKAGDVLPILIDKHDHCWDSARYALEPIMKRRKRSPMKFNSEAGAQQNPWSY